VKSLKNKTKTSKDSSESDSDSSSDDDSDDSDPSDSKDNKKNKTKSLKNKTKSVKSKTKSAKNKTKAEKTPKEKKSKKSKSKMIESPDAEYDAAIVMDLYAASGVACAPKGIKVGSVLVSPHGDGTATVSYMVNSGYVLVDTHLHVGQQPFPTADDGNFLALGDFGLKHENAQMTTKTYTVDLESCDFFIAAQARVCGDFPTFSPTSMPTDTPTIATLAPTAKPTKEPKTAKPTKAPKTKSPKTDKPTKAPKETKAPKTKSPTDAPVTKMPKTEKPTKAPNDGNQMDMKMGMRRELDEDEDVLEDESVSVECRVAFGYHSAKLSNSFSEMGFIGTTEENDNVAWGWTSGPFDASNYEYSFELMTKAAGADKPALTIGNVHIGYDGEEASVTMEAGSRLWLKNVHAYVGTSPLPQDAQGMETVIPEHYPVSFDRMALSRTFSVDNLGGEPIFVVTEATVCGVFETYDAAVNDGSKVGKFASYVKNMLK
jgi:hypothetical protein